MGFRVVETIREATDIRAAIRVVDYKGQRCLLKSYSSCGLVMRKFAGVWLLSREWAVLKRLRGIEGVPNIVARLSDIEMLYEYKKASSISRRNGSNIEYESFLRLERLVKGIHERGVIHFDLRQKKNILFSEDGKPYIVDFATAFYFARPSFGFNRLFELLALVDRSALLKIKLKMFPGKVTGADMAFMKRFQQVRNYWFFRRKAFRNKDLV